jgi:uncharacterized protein
MIPLHDNAGGVRFAVKVVPGSSRERIVGALGDALKIAVSKPPADGQANRAVVKLLAKDLDVPVPMISIVRGHTSARKEVAIAGLSAAELQQRLEKFLK